MKRRYTLMFLLAGTIVGGRAAAAAAAPAASQPAAAPVIDAKWPGPKDERWLAQAIEDELRLAVGTERREALLERLGSLALSWLACGRTGDLSVPVEIDHALRACRYLAVLEATNDEPPRKLAQWLLDHRDARRVLFRALGDVPSAEEALERFRFLQANEQAKVLEYPDLAAAFATAKPRRFYRAQPEPATMLQAFCYYADPKAKFRYNLKKMPYELSRYLADTRVGISERQWAAKRYLRSRNPGSAYFHVKYDDTHFEKNEPKKIAKLDYTLPNLRKVGGVCIDQAYYAAEVCKAIGIPATIVTGQGASGIGHAWFSYFQMNPAGTSASWHGGAGRYASQLYFTGSVIDPATGGVILDSELVLLGSAALLPLRRREEAEAATVLARLAIDACTDGNVPPNVAPLEQLAADYGKRFARVAGAPKLDRKWLAAKSPIDMAIVEGLLTLAVKRNLAHLPAWESIVELGKSKRLATASLNKFFGVLIEKTAGQYPEHSCAMILQIVPTLAEPDKRMKAYRRSLGVYGRRPDLKGRILLAMGDEELAAGESKKAVKLYETAAMQGVMVPRVVMAAAQKAEEVLSSQGQDKMILRLYQALFSKTRKRDCAEEFRKQTSHYRLGSRLADMLRSAGKAAMAERITASL